jgi:hypothetical protein
MSRVEDAFMPLDRLHERFDEVFDRAERLSTLIAERIGTGTDVTALMRNLKQAEAEKKSMLAALRMARHRKSVPITAAIPASRSLAPLPVGRAGDL